MLWLSVSCIGIIARYRIILAVVSEFLGPSVHEEVRAAKPKANELEISRSMNSCSLWRFTSLLLRVSLLHKNRHIKWELFLRIGAS